MAAECVGDFVSSSKYPRMGAERAECIAGRPPLPLPFPLPVRSLLSLPELDGGGSFCWVAPSWRTLLLPSLTRPDEAEVPGLCCSAFA